MSVYGSCNGLVCLVAMDDIYLWNPSTRESKRLPRFKLSDSNSRYNNNVFANWGVFGFGYDDSKNDYKVVFHFNGFQGSERRTEAHIYSLRTNSWRRIDPTYRGILGGEPSKCFNGIVHWMNKPLRFNYPRSIVCFDFVEETYGEVPQPIYGDKSWLWSLGELEGSLCLLTDSSKNRADVWVMKEYGVKESWTKLFTISYAKKPGLFRQEENLAIIKRFCPPFPVSISKNGQIVLEVGGDLILYSDKDKTFTYFLRSPFESNCNMHSFGESLVSPNALDKY